MISVLILTKNEELDIGDCLTSLAWCDDVQVFDSFSIDKTIEIAKSGGAIVTQREFDGYASQRNAALDGLTFKYSWILIIDADERIPSGLESKLLMHIKSAADGVNGFRIRRRDFLGNTWLKHCQMSPFYIRLVRKGKARYHREVNEVLEVDGLVADIDGYFDHYPFSKGYTHWLSKHNFYASMEAQQWFSEHTGATKFSFRKALFSRDFSEKRFHQKGLFYKLPMLTRPMIKWLYLVVFRMGFLDGSPGLIYSTLQAIYEYFIVLKSRELMKNNTTQL